MVFYRSLFFVWIDKCLAMDYTKIVTESTWKGESCMNQTFCGKSCETCGDKEKLQCSGCMTAHQPNDSCPIARCCTEKQRSGCEGCQEIEGCAHYAGRERAAAERQLELEHQKYLEQRKQDRLSEKKGRVRSLSKWLMVLFVLYLCNVVVNIVFYPFTMENAPTMYFIGLGINTIIVLIAGYAYNRLGDENKKYENIAWVCWASAFGGVVVLLGAIYAPYLVALWGLIGLVLGVLSLLAVFWEMRAHSEVLEGIDNRMAEKWDTLRKWTFGLMIASIVTVLLAFISVLGAILLLASLVGELVVEIMALIYRYQTAKIFKAQQEKLGL